MRSDFRSSALAALFLGMSSLAGHAAQIPAGGDLGVFTGAPMTNSATFGDNNVTGSFDDLFTFTLAKNARVSISYTTAYSDPTQFISDFDLRLFSGFTGTGTPLGSTTATNTPDPSFPGSGSEDGRLVRLSSIGEYSFRISGTTNGDSPSYGGSLSIRVSTVPLPASAPMFGAALLALAGLSYGAKRKKAAATA